LSSSKNNEVSQRPAIQRHVTLSLESATNLDAMCGRLQIMMGLEKVHVFLERSFFIGNHAKDVADSLERLMEIIAFLPELQWLKIYGPFLASKAGIPFSALAKIVKRSKTLKYLHISHLNITMANETECPVAAMAELLKKNSNIREMRLHFGSTKQKFHPDSQQSILEMIQHHNNSLECFDLDHRLLQKFSPRCKHEIAFFLMLNQNGLRKRLLSPDSNATHEDWCEALAENSAKTDVIFYFLSSNPIFCVP